MGVKYLLTDEAKYAAQLMVADWKAGRLDQYKEYSAPPTYAVQLLELAAFKLIQYNHTQDAIRGDRYRILLMQELRNAVVSDFTVSDYFLTLNAVGNIITNSTTGPVQGIGMNEGTVHQTVTELADDIESHLGQDFLKSQTDLKQVIDELRNAVKSNEQSKLGKVISELRRCIDLGASAVTLTPLLYMLLWHLQRGG